MDPFLAGFLAGYIFYAFWRRLVLDPFEKWFKKKINTQINKKVLDYINWDSKKGE